MRSDEAESEPGWDVVLPRDGMSLDGVRMAGFRERAATGVDLRVLPRPAVVVLSSNPVSNHHRI